jgi:hypothetical protein
METTYTIVISNEAIFPVPSHIEINLSSETKIYNSTPIKHIQLKPLLLAHSNLVWNLTLVTEPI